MPDFLGDDGILAYSMGESMSFEFIETELGFGG
jgi:hypothetical protein